MEKRISNRVSRSFAVSVFSETFGQSYAIARNVSCGGIMLEMPNPLPLGTSVSVQFAVPEAHSQIVMRGEVKHLYILNLSPNERNKAFVGMGIRFTEFEKNPRRVLAKHLHEGTLIN